MTDTPATGNDTVDAVLATVNALSDTPLSEQLPVLSDAQEALAAILDAPSSAGPKKQ
ncbi:MAG: hypothetical protein LBM94_04920 [Propionibacteriaceae bacterium]|jgi:hypothetical protein|nr:hypothetical protein [Propionibacteriaceae bacterium]